MNHELKDTIYFIKVNGLLPGKDKITLVKGPYKTPVRSSQKLHHNYYSDLS